MVLNAMAPDKLQGYLFDKPSAPQYINCAYIDENSKEYSRRMAFVNKMKRLKEKAEKI